MLPSGRPRRFRGGARRRPRLAQSRLAPLSPRLWGRGLHTIQIVVGQKHNQVLVTISRCARRRCVVVRSGLAQRRQAPAAAAHVGAPPAAAALGGHVAEHGAAHGQAQGVDLLRRRGQG
jgi:hypothetical protein